MTKDVYKVIENPANLFFKYEVWMKGMRPMSYNTLKQIENRISAHSTKEQAEGVKKYWEELQNFKGENSSAENSIMNNEEMREAYV